MKKDDLLFSLVGVGFGLFFGFSFATWANQRAAASRTSPARGEGEQSSIAVADRGKQSAAELQAAVRLARENAKDYDAQMAAARLSYEAERYDDALGFLLRANELKPDSLEPVVALGHVNADARNYQAAEKWFAAALVKEPNDADVRADLARTLLLRQPPDYERAAAELRRVLQSDPRHEAALQFLSFVLAQKGEQGEARATVERLAEVNPQNPSIKRLREEIEARAAAPAAGRDAPR
jgi:tetratricopeptide (TPR) repeat protein